MLPCSEAQADNREEEPPAALKKKKSKLHRAFEIRLRHLLKTM